MKREPIVLIGFMGAGKTTVGRILATKLGLRFVDVDEMVEQRAGTSIEEIFRAEGEPAFRERERTAAHEALAGSDVVVSLGGGSLEDPTVRSGCETSTVVHLEVSYGEALRRVGGGDGRPMLLKDPRVLYRQRGELYRSFAGTSVATDGRDPIEIADELAAALGGAGPAPDAARVTVDLGERGYDIVIGEGLVRDLGRLLPELPDAEKAFVVTHESLERYVPPVVESLRARGLSIEVLTIPEGEAAKSLAVASSLYERLARASAHRHDLVVALGGGVITDLAGFVASTYARGMSLVNVPTTLLAQVDAAIGGKTAVNLPAGKNLVGSFHQPILVLSDVALLATCPVEEIRAGLAEVIKYGFIADPGLLDVVEARMRDVFELDAGALIEIVTRSSEIKASIVAGDERESGTRAHLNYGHTFAHAIERARRFSDIRHGEAVALGMMAAAYLARELGRIELETVDRHRRALEAAGLPVGERLEFDELEDAWKLDKKYRRGVRFVLLSEDGKPEADVEAPWDAVRRAVERLAR